MLVLSGLAAGSGHATSTNAKSLYEKQRLAIVAVFCDGHVNMTSPCPYGAQALVVASLEGGMWHWIRGTCNQAVNGQYLGCFQMGSSERAKYGHGSGVWAQARAAYRYFKASGRDWSPWSCKPGGYCLH